MKCHRPIVLLMAAAIIGCQQDPRIPLDEARRDINDIQAYQVQAQRLVPLQEDIQRALGRDPRVLNPQAGLHFTSSDRFACGARLLVGYVLLLELKADALPSTQPAELDRYVQDLVRNALAACGWEVEEVNTYCHENQWRIRGRLRGEGKPPSAGAGLDLLPDRRPAEKP